MFNNCELRQFEATPELLSALVGTPLLKKIGESYLYGLDDHQFCEALARDSGKNALFVGFGDRTPVFSCLSRISDREASFWGRPIKAHYGNNLDTYGKTNLLKQLKKKMLKLEVNKASFLSDPWTTKVFFDECESEVSQFAGSIDLTEKTERIFSGIRKSYKSLINWGKRELHLTEVDKSSYSEDKLHEFAAFHEQVAGRKTRSWETWLFQGELVKEGRAVMILAHFEGRLVAAVFSLYGRYDAFYGVAVNDRVLMGEGKPIGHWPLYRSILRAKEDGLERFRLGPVGVEPEDEKASAITKFKRGFSTTIEMQNILKLKL